ncbi:MAG: hypothetical protein HZB50_08140 [Chloroflexi bacterium]|nr:hypothetical protein [Chloroflexota bacterium]
MGAFVNHEFEKGFFLDEEHLRKINDILVTRTQQDNLNCKPLYKVYRADTFTYTTEDVQQILSETNAEWQKITRIVVSLNDKEFSLILDFNPLQTTKLHIEGDERDKVFLLFSELRQYLSNEVNILKKNILDKKNTKIFSLILFSVYMIWAFSNLFEGSTNESVNAVLASNEANMKLNFLIERYTTNSFSKYNPTFYGLILVMLITMFDEYILKMLFVPINYLFPSYLFLFGKEIDRHVKRMTLKQNLLWGVIISSIISLVTGFVVWVVTK